MNEQYVDYANNATKLFKLIEEGRWDDANTFCSDKEARTWVVKKDEGSKSSITWRRLPLHEACIRNAPVKTISIILKAYPNASKLSDSYGRLPLHHACINNGASNCDVIEQLLLSNPQSLESVDVWGKTPLSTIQSSNNNNNRKQVRFSDDYNDNDKYNSTEATTIIDLLNKPPSYYVFKNIKQKQQQKEDVLIEEFNNKMQDFILNHQKEIEILQKEVMDQKEKLENGEHNESEDVIPTSLLQGGGKQYEYVGDDGKRSTTSFLWLWVICVFSKVIQSKKGFENANNNKSTSSDDNNNDVVPEIESSESDLLAQGYCSASFDVNNFLQKNNEQIQKSVIEEASQHFIQLEQKAFALLNENTELKENSGNQKLHILQLENSEKHLKIDNITLKENYNELVIKNELLIKDYHWSIKEITNQKEMLNENITNMDMQEGSFKSILSLFLSQKELEIEEYRNKDVNAIEKIKELESKYHDLLQSKHIEESVSRKDNEDEDVALKEKIASLEKQLHKQKIQMDIQEDIFNNAMHSKEEEIEKLTSITTLTERKNDKETSAEEDINNSTINRNNKQQLLLIERNKNITLQLQNEEYIANIKALQNTNNDLNDKLNHELEQKVSYNVLIESSFHNIYNEIKYLTNELDQTQVQKSDLQNDHDIVKEQYEILIDKFDIISHSENILLGAVEEQRNQRNELIEEVNLYKSSMIILEEKIKEDEFSEQTFNQEKELLEQKLQEQEQNYKGLQFTNKSNLCKISLLESKIKDCDKTITSLKNQNQNINHDKNDVNKTCEYENINYLEKYEDEVLLVKEKDTLITSSEVRINEQNAQITTLEHQIKDQEIELLQLKGYNHKYAMALVQLEDKSKELFLIKKRLDDVLLQAKNNKVESTNTQLSESLSSSLQSTSVHHEEKSCNTITQEKGSNEEETAFNVDGNEKNKCYGNNNLNDMIHIEVSTTDNNNNNSNNCNEEKKLSNDNNYDSSSVSNQNNIEYEAIELLVKAQHLLTATNERSLLVAEEGSSLLMMNDAEEEVSIHNNKDVSSANSLTVNNNHSQSLFTSSSNTSSRKTSGTSKSVESSSECEDNNGFHKFLNSSSFSSSVSGDDNNDDDDDSEQKDNKIRNNNVDGRLQQHDNTGDEISHYLTLAMTKISGLLSRSQSDAQQISSLKESELMLQLKLQEEVLKHNALESHHSSLLHQIDVLNEIIDHHHNVVENNQEEKDSGLVKASHILKELRSTLMSCPETSEAQCIEQVVTKDISAFNAGAKNEINLNIVELDNLQEENKNLKDENYMLEQKINKQREKTIQYTKDMEEQKQQDAKTMTFLQKSKNDLNNQLTEYQTKNQEHQEVFETMTRSHDYLHRTNESLSREVNKLQTDIQDASLQHTFTLQETETKLKRTIQSQQQEIVDLEEKILTTQDEIFWLSKSAKDDDKSIASLKAHQNKLMKQLDIMKDNHNEQQEIDRLEALIWFKAERKCQYEITELNEELNIAVNRIATWKINYTECLEKMKVLEVSSAETYQELWQKYQLVMSQIFLLQESNNARNNDSEEELPTISSVEETDVEEEQDDKCNHAVKTLQKFSNNLQMTQDKARDLETKYRIAETRLIELEAKTQEDTQKIMELEESESSLKQGICDVVLKSTNTEKQHCSQIEALQEGKVTQQQEHDEEVSDMLEKERELLKIIEEKIYECTELRENYKSQYLAMQEKLSLQDQTIEKYYQQVRLYEKENAELLWQVDNSGKRMVDLKENLLLFDVLLHVFECNACNDFKTIENTVSIFSKYEKLERKYQQSISTIKALELKAEEDGDTLDRTLQTLQESVFFLEGLSDTIGEDAFESKRDDLHLLVDNLTTERNGHQICKEDESSSEHQEALKVLFAEEEGHLALQANKKLQQNTQESDVKILDSKYNKMPTVEMDSDVSAKKYSYKNLTSSKNHSTNNDDEHKSSKTDNISSSIKKWEYLSTFSPKSQHHVFNQVKKTSQFSPARTKGKNESRSADESPLNRKARVVFDHCNVREAQEDVSLSSLPPNNLSESHEIAKQMLPKRYPHSAFPRSTKNLFATKSNNKNQVTASLNSHHKQSFEYGPIEDKPFDEESRVLSNYDVEERQMVTASMSLDDEQQTKRTIFGVTLRKVNG